MVEFGKKIFSKKNWKIWNNCAGGENISSNKKN